MTIRLILLFLCACFTIGCVSHKSYSPSNAHSHNDYEQASPFHEAYDHGFGSIEADIFLVSDSNELMVAHTPEELNTKKRRLDSLYLIPLEQCIKKNNGHVYADPDKKLQILIDVKTAAAPTIDKLVKTLERYPDLIHNKDLTFAISGNRPSPDSFALYPSFIEFDGELNKTYSGKALDRIVMMSDNLTRYTKWKGNAPLPEADSLKLLNEIKRSHSLNKPVRFWEAPDSQNAWKTLMLLNVDYINTDHIPQLAAYLESSSER